MRLCATLACASTLLVCGCGTTPTARWASASEALTTARETTLDLHDAGVIDGPTLIRLDKIEKTVRGALRVAETQLPDGGDTFELWMLSARGGLKELAKTYAEVPK